jgi:hypothetical protein
MKSRGGAQGIWHFAEINTLRVTFIDSHACNETQWMKGVGDNMEKSSRYRLKLFT